MVQVLNLQLIQSKKRLLHRKHVDVSVVVVAAATVMCYPVWWMGDLARLFVTLVGGLVVLLKV